MVRLLDARTGSYAEIRPFRHGIVRLCAHIDQSAAEASMLSVLVTADVLARVVEMSGAQALTAFALTPWSPQRAKVFERAAGALGVHPPARSASRHDIHAGTEGPIDVHVVTERAVLADSQHGLLLRVATADAADERTIEAVIQDPAARDNPLAVRLALLSAPLDRQEDLTQRVLTDATTDLAGWRRSVAAWAESPSAPVPAPFATSMRAAFGELDTGSVVALLRGLALDASTPDGAKFEAFAYADRVLGLELTREIGQPPP
jgi:hypothetical protein